MALIIENAPNPQFARNNWIDLCGRWRFRYDDENVGLEQRWHDEIFGPESEILVPFPPESELSGIGDPGIHPVVWYQRELPRIGSDAGETTLIRFGAVDYQATVWVNGVFVQSHTGGSSPFTVEIPTSWLNGDGTAVITVRAFDDPVSLEQPRGKQSWSLNPEGIFYKRTTGIWQPVWLETVPSVYTEFARWQYDATAMTLCWYVELNRTPTNAVEITVEVDLPTGGRLTDALKVETRIASGVICLESEPVSDSIQHLLWSPESPTLLPTRITTSTGDEVIGYIGLRDLKLNRQGFHINGKSYWMRMVLSQGYFPESLYASPSTEAARQEVELTLALGFNGARSHQKAEDPRYLYWADKKGLMIWGEIGATYVWSDLAIERLSNEWRELVRRDINHPSIVAWTPFNESWGITEMSSVPAQQDGVRALYALTNAIDGTRPVVGNDGWEHVVSDVYALHDYTWDVDELRQSYASGRSNSDIATTFHTAGRKAIMAADFDADPLPIMLTEYGGVSYAPADDELWYGYGKVSGADEFARKYAELNAPLHESTELVGVCYTQLTDTEQETNGLLREDRTPKLPFDILSAITKGNKA